MTHQATNGDDITVLHTHNAVRFIDVAGRQGQTECSQGAQIDGLVFFGDHADHRMHMQDDVAIVINLWRDIQ